jgi:peptidoglycan/xylan/chitin deacetylase (PgdA/CDA1 family)
MTDRFADAVFTSRVFTSFTRRIHGFNNRHGGIIVAFHEISLAQLSKHLNCLSQLYTFVSLSEFVKRLREGKSTSNLAAITFDDGYAEVVESAAQLAEVNSWPMTFFIPTRYLDTRQPFWFQELRHLFQSFKHQSVTLRGKTFKLRDKASISKTLNILNRWFIVLDSLEQVDELLREIRYTLSGSEQRLSNLPACQPVAWTRVCELLSHEELSFQAHSVSHLALSCLPEDSVREEMLRSRARIEEVTARKVEHFCYPYGGVAEIGAIAPSVARSLFSSATTMVRGRCHKDADPAMLPRIPLYETDSEQRVMLKISVAR